MKTPTTTDPPSSNFTFDTNLQTRAHDLRKGSHVVSPFQYLRDRDQTLVSFDQKALSVKIHPFRTQKICFKYFELTVQVKSDAVKEHVVGYIRQSHDADLKYLQQAHQRLKRGRIFNESAIRTKG